MGSTIIIPPSAICCSICCVIPIRKHLGVEKAGIEQRRPTSAFALDEPIDEPRQSGRADSKDYPNRFTALLPQEDAQDDAAHADHREQRIDAVHLTRAVVGASRTSRIPDSTMAMMTASSRNAIRHDR